MARGVKARGVTIGSRGGEAMFVTPKPKRFIELNWWVLIVKLKTGGAVFFGVLLTAFVFYIATGATVTEGGLYFMFGFAMFAGIVGFLQPGDRETAPPGETFPKGLHPNR